jgi:hypothetical protein
MKPPPWLQELRHMLAMTSYDTRQEALRRWEQRWLIDLHARETLNLDMLEPVHRKPLALAYAREAVRFDLGKALAKIMVEPTTEPSPDRGWGGAPMLEVRGDVMAIRREPKVHD